MIRATGTDSEVFAKSENGLPSKALLGKGQLRFVYKPFYLLEFQTLDFRT